jgi:hypothetical protein
MENTNIKFTPMKSKIIRYQGLTYHCIKCNLDKSKIDCGNGDRKYNCPKNKKKYHGE